MIYKQSILLALTLAIGSMAQAAPTDLVTTHGRNFVYQDQTFKFVGVNIRGLTHYGEAAPLQWTDAGHINLNLDAVRDMGGKVVRIYVANQYDSNANNIARLTSVLDAMESRGLKAIVVLTDFYESTKLYPQGDDSYYTNQSGWVVLNDSWFSSGYQTNYLPWVQQTVTALKDHNGVFAWEVGNELTDLGNPANIKSLIADTAAAIKAIDPDHMVTTGCISVDHTQVGVDGGLEIYGDENVDFITLHTYNGDDPQQNWEVFSRIEKPLVIEEYGWNKTDNQVSNTTTQLSKWFDERGASGFMQWGFQAQSYDTGDGDNTVGMDPYSSNNNYSALYSLYSTTATTLSAGAVEPPRIDLPDGENVAPDYTDVQTDSDYNASYGGDKALDGVISQASKWTSDGSATPHWIAVDLGSYVAVSGYRLVFANEAGESRLNAFTDYEIQVGDSMSGPWATRFAETNTPQFSTCTYYEDQAVSARYVRLLVNDAGADNYARLPEFEIYAQTLSAHSWTLY